LRASAVRRTVGSRLPVRARIAYGCVGEVTGCASCVTTGCAVGAGLSSDAGRAAGRIGTFCAVGETIVALTIAVVSVFSRVASGIASTCRTVCGNVVVSFARITDGGVARSGILGAVIFVAAVNDSVGGSTSWDTADDHDKLSRDTPCAGISCVAFEAISQAGFAGRIVHIVAGSAYSAGVRRRAVIAVVRLAVARAIVGASVQCTRFAFVGAIGAAVVVDPLCSGLAAGVEVCPRTRKSYES